MGTIERGAHGHRTGSIHVFDVVAREGVADQLKHVEPLRIHNGLVTRVRALEDQQGANKSLDLAPKPDTA